MNIKEGNKLIGEFMGYTTRAKSIIGTEIELLGVPEYHLSLDALIPVWEKLEWLDDYEEFFRDMSFDIEADRSETIQEAAFIVTAQAILELK